MVRAKHSGHKNAGGGDTAYMYRYSNSKSHSGGELNGTDGTAMHGPPAYRTPVHNNMPGTCIPKPSPHQERAICTARI